jgi:hypothetical protein
MFPVWYWPRGGYTYFPGSGYSYFPDRPDYALTVSGGLELSGSGDTTSSYSVESSGGLALGGSATLGINAEAVSFGGYYPIYYFAKRAFPTDYWPEEISSTQKDATGGLTVGGSSAVGYPSVEADGGLEVGGGAGITSPANEREASGGAVIGGTSGVHFIPTPEGGLSASGSADVFVPSAATPESGYFPTLYNSTRAYPDGYFPAPNLSGTTIYEWIPTGGLALAGSVEPAISQGAIDASGGLTFGGTAGELTVMSVFGSGSLALSGEAEIPTTFIGVIAEGGLEVAGSGAWTFLVAHSGSGGLALGGTATYDETSFLFDADGGLVLHGAADYNIDGSPQIFAGSGGVFTGAGSEFEFSYNEEPTGGLTIGGEVAGIDSLRIAASGGLQTGGEAEIVAPYDIGISGNAHIQWTQQRESDGGLLANGAMRWWATLYDVQCDGKSQYVVVGYETDSNGRAFEVRQVCAAPDKKGVHWGDHWFVCPVNGTSHLISEGVKIGGRYYSKDAAWDIMKERSK